MKKVNLWNSSIIGEKYLLYGRDMIPLVDLQASILLYLIEQSKIEIRSFIDLGAGNGVLSKLILEKYPHSFGYICDCSKFMLREAKENLSQFAERTSFLLEDLNNVDWIDETANVDLVISGYAIHHLPDENKYMLYKRIYEKLEHEGVFVNLDQVIAKTEHLEQLNNNYIEILCNKKGITNSYNTLQNDIPASCEDQCEWLKKIGFSDVDVVFKIFNFAILYGKK